MTSTSDIKNGSVILHKNKRMKVVEFLHVKPGKGPAFVRTKLKDISDESLIIQKEILAAFLKFTNPEKKEATAFLDKIG